jgi:hypothetical protein
MVARRGWPNVQRVTCVRDFGASHDLVRIALWSSAVDVVIDLALLAIAVRAGALRRPEGR